MQEEREGSGLSTCVHGVIDRRLPDVASVTFIATFRGSRGNMLREGSTFPTCYLNWVVQKELKFSLFSL